ncbi:MAG: DNA polymerase III subunit alpha [Campylobacterales bacterium]|nr:DNA polymerase III subunit alpha [Campylobacterales bacterium]
MSIKPFTHLHLHTEYSLLDGANRIKDLAKNLKDRGMTSVAITDHGNMFGAIDFYQTMEKEGIKPILGLEAYLHDRDEIGDKSTKQRFHLCLFAKNEIGYKNLMYLSSKSYIDGFYYYPRINKKILAEHSEGLVCTSACLQGEVSWQLNTFTDRKKKLGAKGYEAAVEAAKWYKDVFGEDFYLEIMRHGIMEQRGIDDLMFKIADELDIKVVATNDTHYGSKENAEAHEAFMCISTNAMFDDPNRLKHSVEEFYLKSPEQIATLYADVPELIDNTQEIVDKCNLKLDLGNPTPPNFKYTRQTAEGHSLLLPEPDVENSLENDKVLFAYECKLGLEKRLQIVPKERHQEYWDRLQVEIDIINSMEFPGYMLIVWEFVIAAKRMDIPVGPGRGSAAGSLVAFALEITNIDPMKYGLLFERFLNPERISMPDIDMDFCQARRGDIIDYVVEKYGRYNVAQVITFGSLLAKGVIRDVARVLGVPYADADKMAKLIPDELGINLTKSFEKEPKIKELIESDATAKRVWEFATQLEGLKRNAGTHAAGLVISNDELWNKTPLYRPSGTDDIVTQYDGRFLEDVDLIKFDFLGLKTLTVIYNALKLIEKSTGKWIDFDVMEMDDKKVFETIQSGHTLGLFQIESSGMQQLNAKLKATTFEDLIAVLALYRPGPMESGMLDDFIERKHGRQEIDYFYDEFTKPLKPILEPTYGIIVYQEQVMQIVQTIGGFSLGKADIVRRAMGKKKKDEMEKYGEEFAQGGVEQGYNYDHCRELFNLIEKFAGYGFNKSHSAAYAMITYQTTYLKAYYPAEFMAALLTSEKDNTDKVVSYIDEIKRMKIEFLAPDINRSDKEFTPIYEDGKQGILFGLGAVKGVGDSAIDSILEVRKDGDFTDINNFISRIDSSKVNKKAYDSFTKSGAFDKFGFSRKALFNQQEEIVEAAGNVGRIKKDAVNSLFGEDDSMTAVSLELIDSEEFSLKEILGFEKETLGLYVSGHPLDDFKAEIDEVDYTLSSEIENLADGSEAMFVGKIEEVKEKFSKKGNKFYLASLMDFHGNIELMVFQKDMDKIQRLDVERPIVIKCSISKVDQFTRFNIRKILDLEEAKKEKTKVKVEAPKVLDPVNVIVNIENDKDVLDKISSLAKEHNGTAPLKLTLRSKLNEVLISSKFRVNENFKNEIINNIQSVEVA